MTSGMICPRNAAYTSLFKKFFFKDLVVFE